MCIRDRFSTNPVSNPKIPKPPRVFVVLPVLGSLGFGGIYLFVRSYPFIDFLYPGTSTSSILYLINFPFSYFGKSVNV